ncbi:helix-turn-helix domain-containing protein [Chryseobacterium sp. SIMBA_038]|uniref:helix-turn-helix domain-containing protein n=1 Tax=Chryseobacterium sp. SIMBA_038 TaxID=3085780 RepID=UPI00397D51ED
MNKKTKSIPVNSMADERSPGIVMERVSFDHSIINEEEKQSHRHDLHSFFLLEKGTVSIEIDFQKYDIQESSVIYIHPDQVHYTTSTENITVSTWALNSEYLNPEYLKLLDEIRPVKPLLLDQETFSLISESVSLSLKYYTRKNEKLYHSLLKDSCNTLVALVISQYLEHNQPLEKLSRFEIATKAFKQILEEKYITVKRPSEYAQVLNISTPYLNECIKNTTGYSVSYHIQQRIILEAKRLLYHSNQSVKEIATELGYDDYPYFSRLFTKVVGITPLTFRNKNRD